jgi:hypothetical protein
MQSAWALIGVLFALVVVMNLLTPRRTRQRRRPSRTSRRIDAAVGASPQTVRRPKRTTFVTDEEWRAFGEVKAGITGAKGEDAVKRELARLGLTALHDVILSDSRGLTQVDHLVLGPDGIFVLETKTYGGFITGGLHATTWTQHLVGGTKTAFQNPIRQNHRHCSAVKEVLAGLAVPVHGHVVSAGRAKLGDDLVGVVVPLDCLSQVFLSASRAAVDPADLRRAWDILVAAATRAEPQRAEHLAMVRNRKPNLSEANA